MRHRGRRERRELDGVYVSPGPDSGEGVCLHVWQTRPLDVVDQGQLDGWPGGGLCWESWSAVVLTFGPDVAEFNIFHGVVANPGTSVQGEHGDDDDRQAFTVALLGR